MDYFTGSGQWAPTSLPQMRRQWCYVLGQGLDRLRESGDTPPELLVQAEDDLTGIEKSTLCWVARDMVDLAVGAAASLPEWSPAAAIPTEYGLMSFAKPPAVFDWPVPGGGQSVPMPVDALLWGGAQRGGRRELCRNPLTTRRRARPNTTGTAGQTSGYPLPGRLVTAKINPAPSQRSRSTDRG